ncbi:MAG: ADP-dependent glucokinase/phosphofructokinase [bacterium]|nr:ADP-dependent glucokinase/phosphofructokinase [bacterium]
MRINQINIERIWNKIYRETLPISLEQIDKLGDVVLGFHSTIDGLKKVKFSDIQRLINNNPELKEKIKRKWGTVPQTINSVEDIFIGLFTSMERNQGLQLMIQTEDIHKWIIENLGYDKLRLGGTSGNIANSLSPLGFKKIIVYANPLSQELATLFNNDNNLYTIIKEDKKYILKHPYECYKGLKQDTLHWGFEYPKGLCISFNGMSIKTLRNNRFIAAWNPPNNKLQITDTFKQGLFKRINSISHMVLSGLHLLSEKYPDGSTYRDYLLPFSEYLKEIKRKKSDIKIHYELASISSLKIRQGIVKYIFPIVDSIGMNEVEISSLLEAIGENELSKKVADNNSATFFIEGLNKLMKKTNISRIHLHNLGYYICLTKDEHGNPQDVRDGLIFASILAAYRTKEGFIKREELQKGLAVPISDAGFKQMRLTGNHLLTNKEFYKTGITKLGDYNLIFVPTRVIAKPKLTVGLGDTISASAFLTE